MATVPHYTTPHGVHDAADVAQIVYRSDTGRAIGNVGPRFTPVRHAELCDLFEELAARGHLRSLRCGEFGGGSRVWIQGDCGADAPVQIVPGRDVRHRLTLADAYDGSLSLALVDSDVLIQCANSYRRAHRTGRGLKLRHVASIRDRVDDAIRAIRASIDTAEKSVEVFRTMARTPFVHDNWKALLDEFFPLPEKEQKGEPGPVQEARNRLSWALEYAPAAMPGTTLGAYQAATYYLTHERGRTSHRAESNLLGESARLNESILRRLVASLN